MAHPLDKITIEGFKSIRALKDFELCSLNVLIGGNGAGKSNFLEMFRLLRAMVDQNLSRYVLGGGGAYDFLFNGPKLTSAISAHFVFGPNEYRFQLEPTAQEKLLITLEEQKYHLGGWQTIGKNDFESHLSIVKNRTGLSARRGVGHYVHESVSSWTFYHFHDTGKNAAMRRSEIVEDHRHFRADAGNIAPFLLALKNTSPRQYRDIVDSVRLVTPFFDDFVLESTSMGEKTVVKLAWRQVGSDYPMQPYHFSDGTIRFICLATALLQPHPPSTILIDEPELGLHPYAIEILAEMIRSTAKRTQVIVSTQSPTLVDCFDPEHIVVVNREKGASTFARLKPEALVSWLDDYSLGDLWRKNVVEGGPVREPC
ncbi:AAA family ATPase [Sulfidibacter corallicola]|uniref:AAA family ATPase n=1 Tax=Sulfidibacter corallicola TaxID=2818388 RepID=A0A8A4TNT3_SULCO|nr:AAA family ATPase [Sulfidibacter corallicola]QTD50608.1 AAA family ATPase [Sulfidibacter corallicola]